MVQNAIVHMCRKMGYAKLEYSPETVPKNCPHCGQMISVVQAPKKAVEESEFVRFDSGNFERRK